MKAYLDLLRDILEHGSQQPNRTGIDTISMPGASLRFDLAKSFPAITTKQLHWPGVTGELCAFLRGADSAATMRELGFKMWDGNANDPGKPGHPNAWLTNPFRKGEDDLGRIYGVQWRRWQAFKHIQEFGFANLGQHEAVEKKLEEAGWENIGIATGLNTGSIYHKEIDQVGECIRKIIMTPTDRRILFHAWNPAELDQMALPPCHLLYQFLPNIQTGELSMCMYQRSADSFLGVPFNIASAALLLSVIAHLTGYKPRWLNLFLADAHIYVNHIDQVKEQLSRKPMEAPKLSISHRIPTYADIFEQSDAQTEIAVDIATAWLDDLVPGDFTLPGYISHAAIKAPIAI